MSGMQGQGGFQPVRVTSCSRAKEPSRLTGTRGNESYNPQDLCKNATFAFGATFRGGGSPYISVWYFLHFQKKHPKNGHFWAIFLHFHTTIMSGMQGQGGFQ